MLYREIIAVCSQIHTKHINTLCGQNVELLNVQPGGTYSYHRAVQGYLYRIRPVWLRLWQLQHHTRPDQTRAGPTAHVAHILHHPAATSSQKYFMSNRVEPETHYSIRSCRDRTKRQLNPFRQSSPTTETPRFCCMFANSFSPILYSVQTDSACHKMCRQTAVPA